MLQRRPNTFAQTNLLPHFSLATKRRTIHSGLPVTRHKSGCRQRSRINFRSRGWLFPVSSQFEHRWLGKSFSASQNDVEVGSL